MRDKALHPSWFATQKAYYDLVTHHTLPVCLPQLKNAPENRHKFMAAFCEQKKEDELWMNRDVFENVWEHLIRASNSYYTITDLSIYPIREPDEGQNPEEEQKWNNSRDKDIFSWNRRIDDEIRKLKDYGIPGEGKEFKKVIVYAKHINQPLVQFPCESTGNNDRNCSCNPKEGACNNKECLVWNVYNKWHSELSGKSDIELDDALILRGKRDISTRFGIMNEGLGDGVYVGSVDIGLFGGKYIGEEYKYPKDFSLEAFSYLYRFRKNPEIVARIKRTVFEQTGNF